MSDPALLWTAKPPPPRQPRVGELLFEFLRSHDDAQFVCELRVDEGYGVEAQFYVDGVFLVGRRFPERRFAVAWAEAEREHLENDSEA